MNPEIKNLLDTIRETTMEADAEQQHNGESRRFLDLCAYLSSLWPRIDRLAPLAASVEDTEALTVMAEVRDHIRDLEEMLHGVARQIIRAEGGSN